jgi:peptidoglycan/xylan/chitin deacetylase (PgdA/CDA1 family)
MLRKLKQLLKKITYSNTITAKLILITLLINFNFSFAGYAVILIYHKFDKNKSPSTSIPIKDFENQMRYLKENNFNVISIEKLVYYLKNKKEIPEKTVVITIDDGYKSTMKAFKVLKKYNFPFTLFLYMEAVGRYPDFLTIDQINKLKKYPKITFGNHSYTHLKFAKYPSNGDLNSYRVLLKDDIVISETRFKKIFGYKPKYYAFPYGEYNEIYIDILKKSGYEALFTQDPSSVGKFTDRFLIPRQPIVGHWGSLKHFKKILNIEPLHVLWHYPKIGFLEKNPLPYIKAKIEDLDRYKNCGIYVSELGWKKAKRKKDYLYIQNLPKLKRWKNRIGITCFNKETKKEASFFYMIVNKFE